jgi:N-acetylneuraminic acid mutarotase
MMASQASRWRSMPAAPFNPTGHLPSFTFWTGREVLVIAGGNWGSEPRVYGASFDPQSDRWTLFPEAPLDWRDGFSASWSGSELLVWGGSNDNGALRDGAAYDPSTRSWRYLADCPIEGRAHHAALWHEGHMYVVGGASDSEFYADGAVYSPSSDSWRALPPLPGIGRRALTAVSTGSAILIWGGLGPQSALADGASYRSDTDAWTALPTSPLAGREGHSALWTGREMIIWGGTNRVEDAPPFSDGAAFDPTLNAWRNLSSSPLQGRYKHSAIWAERVMLIWGGSTKLSFAVAQGLASDGAAYDPTRNRWYSLPRSVLSARYRQNAVWTGDQMIVWGGCCNDPINNANFSDGAVYSA